MRDHSDPMPDAATAARKLFAYCRENNWAGYDPYDALNSRIFMALPALDSRIPRLVLTQLLKRSPVNIRGLLQVSKTQNPKGIALFLAALLKAPELCAGESEDLIAALAERLVALRSPGTRYWCWGYSFPWQTRTIIVPVSYTHLDVYKRQVPARPSWPAPALEKTPSWERAPWLPKTFPPTLS